jgi:hypothetical protein
MIDQIGKMLWKAEEKKKELQAENESLRAENAYLKSRISELEAIQMPPICETFLIYLGTLGVVPVFHSWWDGLFCCPQVQETTGG